MTTSQSTTTKGAWRFFVFSAIGIFAFFVPFTVAGKNTILLDHMVGWVEGALGEGTRYLILAIILAGAVYPFATGRWRSSPARMVFALLNVLGLFVGIMLVSGVGPAFLFEPNLGPFLYDKLVIPVGLLIPLGGIFLAFLVGFGLMEFIGVLVQPFMRPVFKTPGRSAIDAVASFVGSYSLGLLVTNRVYRGGGYTAKEASIIAAGFSTVSATFMVVIARTLDLMPVWGMYFAATLVVTFVVTVVLVRIPPLSRISEDYHPEAQPRPEAVITSNRLRAAWSAAGETLQSSPPVWRVVWQNFRDGVVMVMQILPGILSVGLIGLLIATYTPVFKIIGLVFWPLLVLLRIPEPVLASEALSIGLAEIFLPATLVAGHAPPSQPTTRPVPRCVPSRNSWPPSWNAAGRRSVRRSPVVNAAWLSPSSTTSDAPRPPWR